ncbi:cobalt-precorrin-6A reductase [Rhodobacterales bacterium 59_46_T64]|nr:cobalt-precorrin-6A reductase [Rhodobacterales bacterium 59_46_T64]
MTVLVLAGTREAAQIAKALAEKGTPAVASLAGATRAPKPMPLPTRMGGFGGADGFAAYLRNARITAVLDATHPFALRITRRSAEICAAMGIPYAQVLRPAWEAGEGDNWTILAQESEAADHVPRGARVFLATGRQTLMAFAPLADKDCTLICRQIDPPTGAFPFPKGEFMIGRPPFSVDDEIALFQLLGIEWLIVKNAGGEAPRSKLIAARRLGIPVGMIARPAQPDVLRFETIAPAIAWAEEGVGTGAETPGETGAKAGGKI